MVENQNWEPRNPCFAHIVIMKYGKVYIPSVALFLDDELPEDLECAEVINIVMWRQFDDPVTAAGVTYNHVVGWMAATANTTVPIYEEDGEFIGNVAINVEAAEAMKMKEELEEEGKLVIQ